MSTQNSIDSLSAKDQQLLDKFVQDNALFLGPDPEIMSNHSLSSRSEREERVLSSELSLHEIGRIRDRVKSGLEEGFEMVQQMGAAPGAKWGDLTTAVYSASGDLVYISTHGVLAFSAVLHYPIKYIIKNWVNEPTVGVNEGDGFIHNDARFGNVHNTDQSLIMPVFEDGVIIAWVAATVHEGECGAIEPGGMPSMAETPYDEGLKMSPFKIIENFKIKKDLLTFLQNSVREPKLQFEDIKVKLFACMRIKDRVEAVIEEVGGDLFVGALRKNLEDIEIEVRRRISDIPDGTVRAQAFMDSSLRENLILKMNLELTVKGDRMIWDLRGSSPQLSNRAINSVFGSVKGSMLQCLCGFIWPEIPHGIAVISPIEIIADKGSFVDSTDEVPNAQSLQTCFQSITLLQQAMTKLIFSSPNKYGSVVAPWFNQINTFLFGGLTQHNELVGNICADLNGMGGGARANRDGENSVAPLFAAMADFGEQELLEEELPFMQLISKKILKDNQAFGKYRGGMGYQMGVAAKDTLAWGFMTVASGSKITSAPGLFGGYGCPTYPLCKIKNTNVYEILRNEPEKFKFDLVELMNEQEIEGATYSTHHMGMGFEPAAEGEMYMISQGSGGGYGDVLERDPQSVIQDLQEEAISHETALQIYKVIYDKQTLALDVEATQALRSQERKERIKRGVPFAEFEKKWTKEAPPKHLPYYGSWNDKNVLWADGQQMQADSIMPVLLPNPKDVEIAKLHARISELQAQVSSTV